MHLFSFLTDISSNEVFTFYQAMKQAIHERKQRLFLDKSVAEAFQTAVETICRQTPSVGQQPSEILPLAQPSSAAA